MYYILFASSSVSRLYHYLKFYYMVTWLHFTLEYLIFTSLTDLIFEYNRWANISFTTLFTMVVWLDNILKISAQRTAQSSVTGD